VFVYDEAAKGHRGSVPWRARRHPRHGPHPTAKTQAARRSNPRRRLGAMGDAAQQQAVGEYSDLAREQDRLRLYGVLQLSLQSVAKVFLVGDGHTHVLAHVRVGDVEKWGRPGPLHENGASWDELLRFNIAVVPCRRHPLNLVKLTLYSVSGEEALPLGLATQYDQLSEVGAAMFHLHDMIQAADEGGISDCFSLWDEFQTVGELHLGVDFMYGEFGQGRSERVVWAQDAAEKQEDEEQVDEVERASGGGRTEHDDVHVDIADCFQSLYLAAAAQDNEIKAARAGSTRIDAFAQAHAQLPTREERLALVRHQVDAPAMQLPQRRSLSHGEPGGSPDDAAVQELPLLASGLMPLNTKKHWV
jgi:hypothetical protein